MSKERKIRVSVNLHPDMFERLGALAERVGMPPATLAAVFIGEQVSSKELGITQAKQMTDNINLGEVLQKAITDPNFIALCGGDLESKNLDN